MAHLSEKDDEIRAVRSQCQTITMELEKLIVEKVDVAPDGSFIIVENTSVSHDEKIGEWKLRSSSTGRDISFIFPKDFVLTPKSKVTVYARGKGLYAPPHSLVFEAEELFATGGDVHVYLYNEENQVRMYSVK
uniref:LTD domain-containing protein n=1 Tax=Angiostrongylus cantonensis TaxID=6313 RepID=A0A0K0D7N6_ANGCA